MAYAALVSLAQTLDQILLRYSFVAHHEKQQIQYLQEKIIFLSTFLENFPREATKLEARITLAANKVEDIFEYHILNLLNCFQQTPSSLPDSIYADPNLETLYKEIDSILKEAMEIKSSFYTEEDEMMSTHSSASFSSALVPDVKGGSVVGFEKALLEIKYQIYGESAKLVVIPIVGMGGIGKTTLARYVLVDPLTLHHFDVSGFVSVSQNYDKATILLCLLNSIDASTEGQCNGMSSESLLQRVYKYLKGRRFLIVVDDIWNADTWDDLRRVFPDDFNGSRIIITTRNLDVASHADSSSHSYEMHFMGVELSWNLLRHKVFEEEQCPLELEEIGREIAEKCRGLPLAIVVIAGVLSKLNRMQDTWKKIARNVNEAVNTSDEPFTEILSLSYTYLPHHLRPCFLYMGGFPEDDEIHVSKLIRLWVAEGFLKPNGSKDLEEVAEDYLEELATRSLVMITKKKRYNGKIKTIKMHDLLRDLCIRKADDEKFLCVIHEYSGSLPEGTENSRRISILSNSREHSRNMDDLPIHTILLSSETFFDACKCCKLLRVVDTRPSALISSGDEIGELLHLRYLAVSFKTTRNISKVPECFSKLGNLQTLIIKRSSYLPLGIWRMQQLRHVIIWGAYLPNPSADQVLPLEKLQTLKQIRGFRCSERILELVPNLKKLGIAYSSGDINKPKWSKYGLNNLVHLQKLENLKLGAYQSDYSKNDLSQSLAFPVTLKKMTLRGTAIPWKDMSIVGSLPNLQLLKLKWNAFCGRLWETVEGQFCQLKVLVIDSTDPHDWITESSHFPMLECLILSKCDDLREIPNDIGEIATLQLIGVDCCNSSVVESAKNIEEQQRSFGNYIKLHLKFPPVSKGDAR